MRDDCDHTVKFILAVIAKWRVVKRRRINAALCSISRPDRAWFAPRQVFRGKLGLFDVNQGCLSFKINTHLIRMTIFIQWLIHQ